MQPCSRSPKIASAAGNSNWSRCNDGRHACRRGVHTRLCRSQGAGAVYPYRPSARRAAASPVAASRTARSPHSIAADNFSLVRELILLGQGVGLLPASLCEADIAAGAVAAVLPSSSPERPDPPLRDREPQTLRWREADSNHQYREAGDRGLGGMICCNRLSPGSARADRSGRADRWPSIAR